MKVLFLDVDGVLNSADWFRQMDPTAHGIALELDPKAVRRIQRVIEQTGAKIVLSSTWRKHPFCVAAIEAAGLPIYDHTPDLSLQDRNTPRAHEIRLWLATHPEVEAFAIVDDDSDAGQGLEARFVRTRWKHGLYGKHEKALLALLT